MAGNDEMLIRPKIDNSAARRMQKKLDSTLGKTARDFSKKMGDATKSALSWGIKNGLKQSGSFVKNTFSSAAGNFIGAIRQGLTAIMQGADSQISKIEERTLALGDTLMNRAQALNVDPAELVALQVQAARKGISNEQLDALISKLRTGITQNPEQTGEIEKVVRERGMASALVMLAQTLNNLDLNEKIGTLRAAGFASEEEQNRMIMLGQQLQGVRSFDQMFEGLATTREITQSLQNIIQSAADVNFRESKLYIQDIKQAGTPQSVENQRLIDRQKELEAQQSIRREQALDEALKAREVAMRAQEQLDKLMIQLVTVIDKFIKDYNEKGLAAALGSTFEPIMTKHAQVIKDEAEKSRQAYREVAARNSENETNDRAKGEFGRASTGRNWGVNEYWISGNGGM